MDLKEAETLIKSGMYVLDNTLVQGSEHSKDILRLLTNHSWWNGTASFYGMNRNEQFSGLDLPELNDRPRIHVRDIEI